MNRYPQALSCALTAALPLALPLALLACTSRAVSAESLDDAVTRCAQAIVTGWLELMGSE